METQYIEPEGYAWDCQAGPIFGYRRMAADDAIELIRQSDACQIITVLLPDDDRPEIRQYFAFTLDQALARALEVQTRLLAQHTRCCPIQIRPATTAETEAFFSALHELEARMPRPIPSTAVDERTRARASNSN